MKRQSKVLILIPHKEARGGITNYYYTLKKYFSIEVKYLLRGARKLPYNQGFVKEYARIISDIIKFTFILITQRISLIQTTTSLVPKAVIRDGIFILIAKLLGKKVIVFYRGWNIEYAEKVGQKKLYRSIFFKADAVIVLSELAKSTLENWGYKNKIFMETTLVDEELIKNVDPDSFNSKYNNINSSIRLLFLARIEKAKGIFELMEAYRLLQEKYNNLELVIAGDGREENNLKKIVKDKNIQNVTFTGFVSGDTKVNNYLDAHIFVFPSYTEGMPNSVLEAMAFGLPVVTTPVGGLVDFFENDKHGYFIDDLKPEPFSKVVTNLLEDKEKMMSISKYNYEYAKKRFLASSVAKRNEAIIEEVVN